MAKSLQKQLPKGADFHLKIVKEISEILNSPAETRSLLKSVVDYLAESLGFDVVSLYLWDSNSGTLVMTANHGLHFDTSKAPSLRPDEGLTGLVFQERRAMSVLPASSHPRYKFFPDLGEQLYETFLGAPLLLKNNCLGVLNLQAKEPQFSGTSHEALLEIISARIAAVIEVAGRLDHIEHKNGTGGPFRQGSGVASGIAYGPAFKIERLYKTLDVSLFSAGDAAFEQYRVTNAISQVDEELGQLLSSLLTDSKMTEAELGIFKAQRQLLGDPVFSQGVAQAFSSGIATAEGAVLQTVDSLCKQFESLGLAFFRERLYDLRDIEEKLLRALLQSRGLNVAPMQVADGSILMAHEVGPTHLLALAGSIKGVITEVGGEGGHMAILARSLGIPALTGIEGVLDIVSTGEMILVDGRTGFLFVSPVEALVRDYDSYRRKQEAILSHLQDGGKDLIGAEAHVKVSANIGYPGDLPSAIQAGLDDIGLFRTEFSFMQRSAWPSAQEQLEELRTTCGGISGWVTVRTLDIGSDKQLPYFSMPREENPMLGLRSIRFSMENQRFLAEQLRAVLMAWKEGLKVRVLLPMVTQMWEIDTVRRIMDSIARELGMDANNRPPLGMMIEVPGVIWQLDDFLARVDFLSFGTNDLIQYLLCVDRNSSHVGHLYAEHHPIVIRFLDEVRKKVQSKSITVCGEMAGNPMGILILLALGYDHLSVLPQRAFLVRYIAKRIGVRKLAELREELLRESNCSAMQSRLGSVLQEIHPDLLTID